VRLGAEPDRERDDDVWLIELVGAGLRTVRGIDLSAALRRTQRLWQPTPVLAEAMATGLIQLSAEGQLRLTPAEWFREAGWGVEVLRSIIKSS
jgi:HemN C-terminal domain